MGLLLILNSCSSTKNKALPEDVAKIRSERFQKLPKDSIDIVTPYIEVYLTDKSTQLEKQNSILQFTAGLLITELPNAEYHELPIMYEGYFAVNSVLENLTYRQWKYPDWVFKAPNEILTVGKKYSLLITMLVRDGSMDNGGIQGILINNQEKTIYTVERYGIVNNSTKPDKIKKGILTVMSKLLKD